MSQFHVRQLTKLNFVFLIIFCKNTKKGGASAIICQYPSTGSPTVQHYYNNGYSPILLDSTNPSLGITSSSVTVSGSNLVCSFTRQNSNTNTNTNYYNLNTNSPYLIAAYGPISGGSQFKFLIICLVVFHTQLLKIIENLNSIQNFRDYLI